MENNEQEIGFNTQCEQLRQGLTDLINHSNLPIAPVYYIVKDIYNEVQNVYYSVLNTESKPKVKTVTYDTDTKQVIEDQE